jgi:hypothetical protein
MAESMAAAAWRLFLTLLILTFAISLLGRLAAI